MIEIRIIDALHKEDIKLPNEPFELFGKIIPSYDGKTWSYQLERYNSDEIEEMCFPDENYDYDAMSDSVFLGAYDNDTCVGLAVLQPSFFKYMYLYDLKVNKQYRGFHLGKMLMTKAKEIALQHGYQGIYTQAQDNNPQACLFYLNNGFYIGGLDTNVYTHTRQAGKADIILYCEAE